MKRLFYSTLLLVSSLAQADWLDDVSSSVAARRQLDLDRCCKVVRSYSDKDRKEIAHIEKQKKDNTQEGVLSGVRNATFDVELRRAEDSLKYHERVEKYIKELKDNKKEREKFVADCKTIKQLTTEIATLQKMYDAKKGISAKASLGAKIAAKKVHLEGKKKYMESI